MTNQLLTAKQHHRYKSLASSMYSMGDAVVGFHRMVMVKTRKEHNCPGLNNGEVHVIPAGSVVVLEVAKVDGKVGSCYTCLGYLDKWALEINWDAE